MQVAQPAYHEIIDLFARGSSSREVAQFHPSSEVQERARYLLERNKSGDLSASEAEELERFGQLEHLMQLVKARARHYAKLES